MRQVNFDDVLWLFENRPQLFFFAVTEMLKRHPEWLGDLTKHMQMGITSALQEERGRASDLALGLITFVQEDKKRKFRFYHNIQSGLLALWNYFGNTVAWESIQDVLEKGEK